MVDIGFRNNPTTGSKETEPEDTQSIVDIIDSEISSDEFKVEGESEDDNAEELYLLYSERVFQSQHGSQSDIESDEEDILTRPDFGTVTQVHPKIQARGKMTKEEKPLFQYVNTVLQYPACVNIVDRCWGVHTKINFKCPVRFYTSFLASQKVDKFKVEGGLMVKCMEAKLNEVKESHSKLNLDKCYENFESALEGLQLCIAIYQAAHATEKQRVRLLRTLNPAPKVAVFKKYQSDRARELRKNLEGKLYPAMSASYGNVEATLMMQKMWILTGGSGDKDASDGINSMLEFFLGNNLCYESMDKRKLELSDAIYTAEDTSRGKIPILGLELTHREDFDANGLPQCMGVCRHKYVEMCMISAFAFSLWYRFDLQPPPVSGDRVPDFKDNSWYDMKVLFGDNQAPKNDAAAGNTPTGNPSSEPNQEISEQYQIALLKKCLDSIGLSSSDKSRLSRDDLHLNCERNGIANYDLLFEGDSASSIYYMLYPKRYPYDLIHFLGGFKQYEPYYIARDLEPPVELLKMIFPWVEDKLVEVENATDQDGLPCSAKYEVAIRFLKMLQKFRKIIVQDLAARMETSPSKLFCQQPITREPAFALFRDQVSSWRKR
ncbi:hypothetical protein JCM33374_g3839 [Metschnikowia sp. JCM 33374]|nr:hypothetical protein JCM33374_g3839 [Metschnikowia sp. JCM 33374]